jgi:outer membrane lipoprotein
MRHQTRFLLLVSILTGVGTGVGCSSAPVFESANTDPQYTPQVAAESTTGARTQRVFWGGTVLNTTNLQTTTHIEVLSYPLKNNGRPNRTKDPQGRFIVERSGFLDPAKYTQGREITIVGKIVTVVSGKVGEAPYRFPVVKPDQLHLWPKQDQRQRTNVHFGVGVGIYR